MKCNPYYILSTTDSCTSDSSTLPQWQDLSFHPLLFAKSPFLGAACICEEGAWICRGGACIQPLASKMDSVIVSLVLGCRKRLGATRCPHWLGLLLPGPPIWIVTTLLTHLLGEPHSPVQLAGSDMVFILLTTALFASPETISRQSWLKRSKHAYCMLTQHWFVFSMIKSEVGARNGVDLDNIKYMTTPAPKLYPSILVAVPFSISGEA